MEHSRRGEGHENTLQPLPAVGKLDQPVTIEPPVPEASVEEGSERENSEPPTPPGYLTLELDVSDLQACMPETDAAAIQPDWEMDGWQEPEVLSPDLPAFLAPEEAAIPGYLTLDIDLNALADVVPWKVSNNAASDEPRGKA